MKRIINFGPAVESISDLAESYGQSYAKNFKGFDDENTKNGKLHEKAANISTKALLSACAEFASVDNACEVLGNILTQSRGFRTMDVLGVVSAIVGKGNVEKVINAASKKKS